MSDGAFRLINGSAFDQKGRGMRAEREPDELIGSWTLVEGDCSPRSLCSET
jgi:hypothetical protein